MSESTSTDVVPAPEAPAEPSYAGKYLTFDLGGETYALAILKVQEIIRIPRVTRVPGAPRFVRGVINLRGKVTPVVDLAAKFGLPSGETTPRTCIVVVQLSRGSHQVVMGVVVDTVSDVIDLEDEQIESAPDFGDDFDTESVLAMAKVDGRVVVLLDIDRVLSAEELQNVSRVK